MKWSNIFSIVVLLMLSFSGIAQSTKMQWGVIGGISVNTISVSSEKEIYSNSLPVSNDNIVDRLENVYAVGGVRVGAQLSYDLNGENRLVTSTVFRRYHNKAESLILRDEFGIALVQLYGWDITNAQELNLGYERQLGSIFFVGFGVHGEFYYSSKTYLKADNYSEYAVKLNDKNYYSRFSMGPYATCGLKSGSYEYNLKLNVGLTDRIVSKLNEVKEFHHNLSFNVVRYF